MDSFDKRILGVLMDGKPRDFRQLLKDVGFPEIRRRVTLTIKEPQTTIVSLTFQGLKHLCRYEKGGYCKKTERKCEAKTVPKS